MPTKIAISYFKSHCLEIIDKLQTSNQSIIITKRAKPIATVEAVVQSNASIFGLLKGKAKIVGDIVSSIDEVWDAENK